MVDVVVLNYNDADQTIRYVNEVKDYSAIDHIVIVDNNSTDDSYTKLKAIQDGLKIIVIKTCKNGGYGYGNNFGVRYCIDEYSSKYIVISNPDVHYDETTINECCSFLEKNGKYAAVAPRMKNKNGEFVLSGWNINPWYKYISHQLIVIGRITRTRDSLPVQLTENNANSDCDCIAGSFFVIDSKAFSNAGFFDENIFLYCEETSLGFRLKKKGYKSSVLNGYYFIHDHSVSISKTLKNEIDKCRIAWNSRMYLLKNYYKLNHVQIIACIVVKYISITEVAIIHFFRSIRVKIREKKQ